MKINLKFLLLSVSAFIAVHLLVNNLSAANKVESSLAAVAGNESILKNELEARIKLTILTSGMKNTPEVRKEIRDQILKTMIDELLQIQWAAQFKLEVRDDEIDAAMARLEEQNNMKPGNLKMFLKENNIPVSVMRQQLKANLIWHDYIRQRYSSMVQVSDEEVETKKQEQQAMKDKETMLLAEIVLPYDPMDIQSESAARRQANELIKQLESGAQFQLLAQKFSHSPSAARGGDIGQVSVDQLPKPLQETLAKMDIGTVSTPVRYDDKYHIIFLRERLDAGSLGREQTYLTFAQVLLPFPPHANNWQMEEVFRKADAIRRNAQSPEMMKKLADQVSGSQARVITGIPLDQLHPQLREILQKASLNKGTDPVGSESGVFIFIVGERKTVQPYEMTEEDIRRGIIEQKLMMMAERELRNVRRAAFVDIRM
jgi:peptidyl-prolyl cis-trans isomerase SurA